jgi:biotin transport system substrate-specific component
MNRSITLPACSVSLARPAFGWDVLGVAGLIALGSLLRFPLPFSPVPVTLQTFAVLLAACVVPANRAALGATLYLALGLAGAPLFATASGATLGYLIAFCFTPYLVSGLGRGALGLIAATGAIYLSGAAWLAFWGGFGPYQALALGVLPFLPGDLLKAAAVYRLVLWWRC